jgi:hypothetical protein
VFKQSQLTRADVLSTSVDPLIKKLANREPRKLAGVPSSTETDLSAYSGRRLKIGKPPRNTKKTFTETRIGEGRNEDQERQNTEHDCPRTCYERNCDGRWRKTCIKLSKSNSVSTPYSTQQQHLNDSNNVELKITAT